MLSTFAELGASAPVTRTLARRAVTHPFEIQRLVLPDALAGRDVLAKSRTGSGKTLAFAIPIVESIDVDTARPAALVLVPTRELAVQVTTEMRDLAAARNLRVAAVYGGVAIPKQAERARKAHVLVATPGRLLDLLNRKLISVAEIGILVPVDDRSKLDRLIEVLGEERGLALIFVRTKRGAERLRVRLGSRGVQALALHGDMTQAARARSLERFAAGKLDVLVATDVAARGLDLDGISHVINYDPPRDYKDYVHRVGRTARAGRTGTGVTFVSASDRQDLSVIASALKLKDEFQSEGLELAPPRRVYSSRGSRSMMRPRVKRRF